MESPIQSATPRIHFRSFKLDLHTRELFRNGIRVKLQGQPIDVLELLLERPGELVTREELRNKLWPEDTFVDFEHSLNSTVRRLRDALGDDADHPRYIETLPRLGYRFIVAVERGEEATGPSAASTPVLSTTPETPRASAPVLPIQAANSAGSRHRRLRVLGVGMLAVAGLATLAW